MSTEKKVTLKSSDGETFDVDEAVALESQTIKHMIEDDCADNGIPLPNVTSKILARVIEYCKKHVENPKGDDRSANDELKNWDAEFVKVDQATLFDLILLRLPKRKHGRTLVLLAVSSLQTSALKGNYRPPQCETDEEHSDDSEDTIGDDADLSFSKAQPVQVVHYAEETGAALVSKYANAHTYLKPIDP